MEEKFTYPNFPKEEIKSELHFNRYLKFIESRPKNRSKKDDIYYENHHIVPVSLGGSNKKENLILLTAREHFIAHMILAYVFKGKMIKAYYFMSFREGIKLTSFQYSFLKEQFSLLLKGHLTSQETREKISKANSDFVTVKDTDGNIFRVKTNDKRYLRGELNSINKNTKLVIDKSNKVYRVAKDDIRLKTGELQPFSYTKNTAVVYQKDDIYKKAFRISIFDDEYKKGNYVSVSKGKVFSEDTKKKLSEAHRGKFIASNKKGERFEADCDDERFKNGEIWGVHKGRKHTDKSKKRMSKAKKGYIHLIKEDKMIYIESTKEKEYLEKGWIRGDLQCKTWIVYDPKGNQYEINTRIDNFCNENNILLSTLKQYRGFIVPNPQNKRFITEKRLNTTGWGLSKENTNSIEEYPCTILISPDEDIIKSDESLHKVANRLQLSYSMLRRNKGKKVVLKKVLNASKIAKNTDGWTYL